MEIVNHLPAAPEGGDRQLVDIEPRPDDADISPMGHCLLDVAHDDADLSDVAEKPAHKRLPRELLTRELLNSDHRS